jgi:hypothetical protein
MDFRYNGAAYREQIKWEGLQEEASVKVTLKLLVRSYRVSE